MSLERFVRVQSVRSTPTAEASTSAHHDGPEGGEEHDGIQCDIGVGDHGEHVAAYQPGHVEPLDLIQTITVDGQTFLPLPPWVLVIMMIVDVSCLFGIVSTTTTSSSRTITILILQVSVEKFIILVVQLDGDRA